MQSRFQVVNKVIVAFLRSAHDLVFLNHNCATPLLIGQISHVEQHVPPFLLCDMRIRHHFLAYSSAKFIFKVFFIFSH